MKNLKVFFPLNVAVAGFGLLSFLLLLPPCVSAKPSVDAVVTNDSSQRGPTKEEMKNSKPFVNPAPAPDTSAVQPLGGDFPVELPEAAPEAMELQGSANVQAYGEFGVPYTSKRVTHDSLPADVKVSENSLAYLSATFPYRTIGRLNFKDDDGDWTHCSASLILRSVIVTAAHCIQVNGKGSSTYSNWTFVPAYFQRNTPDSKVVAPYGSWVWKAYVRPTSWADGTDTSVGSAYNNDLAVILLGKDTDGQFIGDKTGWLRYGQTDGYFVKSKRTGNLWTAALTTLGYPGKSDNGAIQQRCDGPSYKTSIDSVLQIYQGSDFTGGSSGGPWIANFGYQEPVFSEGAGPGQKSLSNVVVGVTSWGDGEPGPQYDNYSSRFGKNEEYPDNSYGTFGAGNIAALLDALCSKKPPRSDQTYQELGYCDNKK
ncbi:MAG: trypsin-like serine protease [Syntrophobacteraceae bacterium]